MARVYKAVIEMIMKPFLKESHGYIYLPCESIKDARAAINAEYEELFVYIIESKTGIKKLRIDKLGGKTFRKLYEVYTR